MIYWLLIDISISHLKLVLFLQFKFYFWQSHPPQQEIRVQDWQYLLLKKLLERPIWVSF
jgi:hypothetical protein